MNNQEWFKDIKHFEWEELDSKTLEIRAGKHEGVTVVVGYDQESKDIYVLHEEFTTLPTIKPGDGVRHEIYGNGIVMSDVVTRTTVEVDFDLNTFTVPVGELEEVE